MSGPVIKTMHRCTHCGPVAPEHFRDEAHAQVHMQVQQRLCTDDDIVRVAVESRLSACIYSPDFNRPVVVFDETPEDVVKRLTKETA